MSDIKVIEKKLKTLGTLTVTDSAIGSILIREFKCGSIAGKLTVNTVSGEAAMVTIKSGEELSKTFKLSKSESLHKFAPEGFDAGEIKKSQTILIKVLNKFKSTSRISNYVN